jgi:oligopeptide/dipeptide ABC transporter ATP-binding protein
MIAEQPLIEAKAVSASFTRKRFLGRAPVVHAVREINLAIRRGETVGVVGESGSGKSTLGRLLLGLLNPSDGAVIFDGQPLAGLPAADWRVLRRRMQIVFQDPYGSLDPRRRIGEQIGDGLAIHGLVPTSGQMARVRELLALVGLDPVHAERFPHEFSGGQRQRIGIARALATSPEFIVADEPVSSLDVSIQAQILELLDQLRRDLNLAMLFISHDLAVVRHLCDRVMVMYLGRVMEEGPAKTVLDHPRHPYTRALVSATPRIRHKAGAAPRILLPGDPPSPSSPPSGCVFRTRCAFAIDDCARIVPVLDTIGQGQSVACLRHHELT